MKRLLVIALSLGISLWAFGQETIEVKGMKFSYQVLGDEIEIELEAPTMGWVGVGFNERDDIVRSDLYLFHVVGDEVEGLDMYVVGAGNPKEDTELGGTMDVEALEGKEGGMHTWIKFRLPFPSTDTHDFSHRAGKQFWLILAYSTHDEFDHHSRMREHVSFTFEK
ncbi:MAG: DOMON domain-containing protein [Bacteroidota bacterium]